MKINDIFIEQSKNNTGVYLPSILLFLDLATTMLKRPEVDVAFTPYYKKSIVQKDVFPSSYKIMDRLTEQNNRVSFSLWLLNPDPYANLVGVFLTDYGIEDDTRIKCVLVLRNKVYGMFELEYDRELVFNTTVDRFFKDNNLESFATTLNRLTTILVGGDVVIAGANIRQGFVIKHTVIKGVGHGQSNSDSDLSKGLFNDPNGLTATPLSPIEKALKDTIDQLTLSNKQLTHDLNKIKNTLALVEKGYTSLAQDVKSLERMVKAQIKKN